ncbi:dTDP-4-dehydrorhamnose reductase [Candidatus Methylopumilus planktonicus]|uniref:dTDP-4-dehydrorhamnose reductase n=1 Tax=Candidatus Methylopumilus planktonicus TaxID=1581557 RepID=UPI003BEF18BD
MIILLIGKNGQLSSVLNKELSIMHKVFAVDRYRLCLSKITSLEKFIDQAKPDLIINTAAYNQVDQAEIEKDLAFEINALLPKFLSSKSQSLGIPIIHISTNYIFDGSKNSPYEEEDQANPLSVYGKTKWLGEEFVRNNPKHFILRTSWLFSSHSPSFLLTMLKLAHEKHTINIVSDQWGSPTSTKTLVGAIQEILNRLLYKKSPEIYGTYHVACNGKTNWYDYSIKILSVLESMGIKTLLKTDQVIPISHVDYYQKACRPNYSVLATMKYKNIFQSKLPDWDLEVERTILESSIRCFNSKLN